MDGGLSELELQQLEKKNPPRYLANSAGGRLQVVGANTCKVTFPTK